MFVNFSLLRNYHNKGFYFKYSSSPRICHRRNNVEIPICCIDNRKYSAARLVKNYKYFRQFQKLKTKDFHILRKNLSTSSPLLKEQKDPFKGPPDFKLGWNVLKFALLLFFPIFLSHLFEGFKRITPPTSWEEFKYEILAKGEVKSLTVLVDQKTVLVELHDGAIIKNAGAPSKYYLLEVPEIGKFEDRLREAEQELGISAKDRVPISYHQKSQIGILLNLILVLFFSFLGLLFYLGPKYFQNLDTSIFRQTKYTLIDPLMGQHKGVKFSDVAGLKEAKAEIMDFVDYLKRPEVYRSLGAKVPKGALLLGPPGCGKTLLAKAVATEANVPFLSMNGSEFIELIGGVGAAKVRDLFKDAKKRIPCIIYIDEIDAIGKKRESFGSGEAEAEQEHTLNQLLVEMDGMVSNEGVVLLASTNRPDVLDKALLRPGRFDRHILIDLPTFQERQEIFEYHLGNIYFKHPPEKFLKRLAHLTPGFTGADIANVCNEAALHAARLKKECVQADDLEYAIERVIGGTEKMSSVRTPEERKLFAYYEAGRALVGWLSKYGEALLKITIVARTDSPAGWTHFSPSEKYLYSLEDLKGKMCMGLGGRAAVTLLFNRVTTAGEKDLKKVTNLAYALVKRFGMNPNVGLMSFDVSGNSSSLKKPYSKVLGNLFDLEARKLVTEAYQETEKILSENQDKLIKLAEELLAKETLNYEDVVKLIGPPAFKGKTLVEPLEFIQSLDQAIGPDNSAESSNNP